MNLQIHQKPFEVAFISPSPNLFGKSENSIRLRLGVRAKLIPFETPEEAIKAIRSPYNSFELIALDTSAVNSIESLPQFLGKDNIGLPVLLIMRKGETQFADAALEAGYKALLFKDDDAQYRQLFPGMVLRIIAFFRGERHRMALHDYAEAEAEAETVTQAEAVGVPSPLVSTTG